jgi:hypothetical protein
MLYTIYVSRFLGIYRNDGIGSEYIGQQLAQSFHGHAMFLDSDFCSVDHVSEADAGKKQKGFLPGIILCKNQLPTSADGNRNTTGGFHYRSSFGVTTTEGSVHQPDQYLRHILSDRSLHQSDAGGNW